MSDVARLVGKLGRESQPWEQVVGDTRQEGLVVEDLRLSVPSTWELLIGVHTIGNFARLQYSSQRAILIPQTSALAQDGSLRLLATPVLPSWPTKPFAMSFRAFPLAAM